MILPVPVQDSPELRCSGTLLSSQQLAFSSSCKNIDDCRTLWSIIWGCVATLIACTWVSVHPNVPAPYHGMFPLHRLKLMLLAIVAPEIIVLWALRQHMVARDLSKKYAITMVHGFFISMGGFVEPRDHGPRPIAAHAVGHSTDVDMLRETHDFEILDRSKGDEIAKAFALLQTAWFVAQCIARRVQALPLTELEVVTLAFSALNIIIHIIWWHKPLDVRHGVPIGPAVPLVTRKKEKKRKTFTWEGVRKRVEYLAVHLTVDVLTGENENDHIPSTALQVPMLWAGRLDKSLRRKAAAFAIFLAMGFGAIHFVAWNLSFSSRAELVLWRVASIAIVAVPFIFLVNATISVNVRVPRWFRALNFYFFIPFGVLTYVIARVMLMVLPVLSLRSLPSDAYRDVEWTKFIPHIS